MWALLSDRTPARVTELAEWGVRLVIPLEARLSVAQTTSFELHDRRRTLASCAARVVGLVRYELSQDLLLWVLDDAVRWRELVSRLGPLTFPSAPYLGAPDVRLPKDRIDRRLRSLVADRSRVQVRSRASEGSGLSIPGRLDPERGVLLEWDPQWSELQPPYEIMVEGPFSTLEFEEQSLRWTRPQPEKVTLTRRRETRRVSAPSGARVLLHGVAEQPLELAMIDVSFGGIGARVSKDDELLAPGMSIQDVIVTWRGGPQLRFVGEIRHRSPSRDRSSDMIGLRLTPSSEALRERWAREVESMLYPTTRSYGHNYQSIWDLFEASGYFDLSGNRREALDFLLLRDAFEASYRKLAAAPELGCLVSCESPTRVEAALAAVRAWSRSWFGFHMARNANRPHLVNSDSSPLKDIHLHAYERAGGNPDIDWLVGYVRNDAGFSGALRDFMLTIPNGCGVPFEVWKLSVYVRDDVHAPGVSEATPEQVDDVLRRLEGKRPWQYLEAHDLVPATYDQRHLREEWAFYGLMKERTMLVAVEDGQVVAAAVLDAVDDGLHLYGLLDTIRLYGLDPRGREHYASLLLAAHEWFFSMGKSSFVCFEEEDLPEIMHSVGAVSLGAGMVALLPRTAIPEMLERISELAAPK
ncbi:PilZ domain-containing protein [Paraliomyxa miuraensis]|uniref:PilZ domain-containing protein n=1 Tax=Paraliomyxa miuraensis TaxID=376150 RepID=UPI002257E92D|nr:PilZ domain-containing protein [Paraliomyxa miuraensis]MCX4240263.1 PilZ domain-containing protein [Paraliomyxa miuraensis]